MRLSLSISRFVLVSLAGAALTAMAGSATAASINCPVQQVKREVTTQLPGGWWSTPYVSNLTGTEVVQIGGQTALQCKYGPNGAGGRIQRNAPAGNVCTAVAGGFNCLPIVNLMRPIHAQGLLSVPQTYLFDLDDGGVHQHGADVWFQAETSNRLYLVPRNGAKIGIVNVADGSYNKCKNARMSGARLSLADMPVGTRLCARTSEGRVATFRLMALSAGSPKTMKLRFTTWR